MPNSLNKKLQTDHGTQQGCWLFRLAAFLCLSVLSAGFLTKKTAAGISVCVTEIVNGVMAMLELAAVQAQISSMVDEFKREREQYLQKLKRAFETWSDCCDSHSWKQLIDKLDRSRTSWLLARPVEGPEFALAPASPRPATVVAVDGSQIFPDRHQAINCYLINLGVIVLSYGTGETPLMQSFPLLFHRQQDMYHEVNGQTYTVSADSIGLKRTVLEFRELVQQALAVRRLHSARPVAALCDGTLIMWTLEAGADSVKEATVAAVIQEWEQLRISRVPMAGYISAPNSTDVVNSLRVAICPYLQANCDRCQYDEAAQRPCAVLAGVTDEVLFRRLLKEGERSPLFESRSKVLELYGDDNRVLFFYLNVGSEIARVEVPAWVYYDGLLNDLCALIVDQAQKGDGYPVALAEAHEKAVVRGQDREVFCQLLHDALISSGMEVRISRKSARKRRMHY